MPCLVKIPSFCSVLFGQLSQVGWILAIPSPRYSVCREKAFVSAGANPDYDAELQQALAKGYPYPRSQTKVLALV